ncbi:S-formylglutathione hydrolase FrmB [Actinocorallia herbida]|uniref:Acyl-CoA:diacylglycerol acyltransferase n=1 Tax=Actinocorallia herbida TaxID=58109 RepID=A0A3N1D0P9_9ACTN|nr:alpha/beta hydrolase-fold protein [Actinocorallia herbida]ROO87076.1 S-formylglutathione hydrolase FrmB [Actinocorallia herbida]
MQIRANRWRVLAASAVAALAMTATAGTAVSADDTAPPAMANGFGLTQVGTPTGSATDFYLTVTTPQVKGEQHIKIILPGGYHDQPERRYPVLYFLHGAPDDPINQNYPALYTSDEMITVIPDGGAKGWYANWLNQNTALGAQNWENFHLNQVIPFIDANLRTIAAKQSRAIAGISMGGFGALHYAQARPDLFSQTASLSGDIDLSVNSMDLRLAVVASVTDALGAMCASSSGTCSPDQGFAPGVDSDALFGSPYPIFNRDRRWNEVDPSQHMDRLAGMGISIYTGDGGGSPVDLEFWVAGAAKNVKARLDALNLPYYYVNYGDGAGWGTQCNGGHNAYCWEQDLQDLIPRLEQSFAS